MSTIHYTSHLQRYLDCPPGETPGGTLREALAHVFKTNPRLRGYLLDDQGALRHHVAIFINGRLLQDRNGLSDPVADRAEIHVMQALSGG